MSNLERGIIVALVEKNEALKEQLNKAEKVIEYYANQENWDFEEIDQSDVEFCEDAQAKLGGKKARDFILKLEGKCKVIE